MYQGRRTYDSSRDLTVEAGVSLYVVYHHRTNKRLGIDCPEWIFEAVKADAKTSAEKRQHAVALKDERERTESQAVLQDLFPYIPDVSLQAILDHGFQKGSGRVGRSSKLDERVKATLAVNAHIRHQFTPYYTLYQTLKASRGGQDVRTLARTTVYDQIQTIADSWRTGRVISNDAKTRKITEYSQEATTNITSTNLRRDLSMTDLGRDIEQLTIVDCQRFGRSTTPRPQDPRSPGSGKEALDLDRQVTVGKPFFSGVQKRRQQGSKVQSNASAKHQSRPGFAALNEALADMDLNAVPQSEGSSQILGNERAKHEKPQFPWVQWQETYPEANDREGLEQEQALAMTSLDAMELVAKIEKQQADKQKLKQESYDKLQHWRTSGSTKGFSARRMAGILRHHGGELSSEEQTFLRDRLSTRLEIIKTRKETRREKKRHCTNQKKSAR